MNDTVRKGHYPALGRSTDPSLDIVAQRRTWLRVAGLAVLASGLRQAGVAGGALPSMPPAVAAHEVRAGRRHVGHGSAVLPSAGKRLVPLGRLAGGGDSNLSSGISSREGGISTAIEARVDEAILYLQSGHGHALPARAYMHLTPPDRFLEIPEALGLCLAAAIEISSLAASAACWRCGHCHG